MKSFLIVGMGSFGHHLCRALADQKCEVMVADQVSDTLEDLLPLVVSAKVGDCTNEEVLRSFDIPSFDACFVCLGDSNVLGSLQITSLLKELGAKKVFSKADDDVQAKFLLRNGADHVIYPEQEVAVNLAISESSDSIFDCISLTDEYSIYELQPMDRWIGKSLKELNFRVKYNLTVIAAMRDGIIRPNLSPDYTFKTDEHLLVLGRIEDIRKVVRRIVLFLCEQRKKAEEKTQRRIPAGSLAIDCRLVCFMISFLQNISAKKPFRMCSTSTHERAFSL